MAFPFDINDYHIHKMNTTDTLLLEFLKKLDKYCHMSKQKLMLLYSSKSLKKFQHFRHVRDNCVLTVRTHVRCFVLRNNSFFVNDKAIGLSKCYETQSTTSWNDFKSEFKKYENIGI